LEDLFLSVNYLLDCFVGMDELFGKFLYFLLFLFNL